MKDFKIGDIIYDKLYDEVTTYDKTYELLSDQHIDLVIRHATPIEAEDFINETKQKATCRD